MHNKHTCIPPFGSSVLSGAWKASIAVLSLGFIYWSRGETVCNPYILYFPGCSVA